MFRKIGGFLPIIVLFCALSPLGAADFGVLVSTDLSFTGRGPADAEPAWNGSAIPWFSTFLGDRGDLYVSAGMSAAAENETFTAVPELFRTDIDLRFGSGSRLRAGRMYYSDPLGFIAEGLFDGAQFSHNLGGGEVNIGAWYTGLLYKKAANITMNNADATEYSAEFKYSKFYNTYFASKRVIAALGFDHPAFWGTAQIRTAFIGQFDVNRMDNADDNRDNDVGRVGRLHTEYITAKMSIPAGRVIVEGGGALQLAQRDVATNWYTYIAGAGELGISYMISMRNRFSLSGRFASGGGYEDNGKFESADYMSGAYTPFLPITTESQGNILAAKFSGISIVKTAYTARLADTFAVDLSSLFFFKDEHQRYVHQFFTVENGYFLGNELYAQAIWSPMSDIRMNFGGGAFLPRSASDPLWKMSMGLSLAVF